MAAKARKATRTARRAAKPRAAKKSRKSRRAARKAKRVARKARVSRKPKAPKRSVRKAKAKTTKGAKKVTKKAQKPKAPKKVAKKARKPKRVTKKSQTGTRRRVWNGTALYTKGGLMKKDLMINPLGKLVSKKSRARANKNSTHIKKWVAAVKKARKELGITGFCLVNRGEQGIALYKKAKVYYGN